VLASRPVSLELALFLELRSAVTTLERTISRNVNEAVRNSLVTVIAVAVFAGLPEAL